MIIWRSTYYGTAMQLIFTLAILCVSLCSGFLLDKNCPHCNWNGVCNTQTGTCQCYEGFKGSDCASDCGCQGHGRCKDDNTCQCDWGWKWSTSQNKCVMDCSCANGVSCIAPGVCGCAQTCQYGTCWNGQCECWEGYTGATCNTLDKSIMLNHNVSFGMNLDGLSYWAPELKFVDVTKQSQEWITQRLTGPNVHTWDTHEHDVITWRDDGYPASLNSSLVVGKIVLRASAGTHGPQGNFTLLYDGDGELEFKLAKHTMHYNGKGRKVIEFHENSGGILIKIMRTNPTNPLHNLKLILPGFEDRHELFPYYPPFLESLKRFSEVRFMDFFHTNGHTPEPTTWSTRRLSDFHTQASTKGCAIEYAIQLVNILGVDPWFNQPHAATDFFTRHFAHMAKSDLRPDVKIYVEYSNEVWNGIFRQTKYTQEQGMALGLDAQTWKAGLKYYNKKSTEIVNIWSSVFSDSPERVIPVWAWQTGYQDFTRQAIEDLGSRVASFKGLAITGYFGCDHVTSASHHNISALSMDEIAALCQKDLKKSIDNFQYYMNMSKSHNLKLLMYEGGPGLESSQNDPATSAAVAFNRHDLIETATSDVLEAWYQYVTSDPYNTLPGGLFNYFTSTSSYTKYGSWGMMEYTGQDPYTSPKYRAVHRYINKHFGNHTLQEPCSFVSDGSGGVFGCFPTSDYSCGHLTGTQWANFVAPSLHSPGTSRVVIADGFDPMSRTLFVRSVDNLEVNTYSTYDTSSSPPTSRSVTFDEYYRLLSPGRVLQRQPYNGYASLLTSKLPSTC